MLFQEPSYNLLTRGQALSYVSTSRQTEHHDPSSSAIFSFSVRPRPLPSLVHSSQTRVPSATNASSSTHRSAPGTLSFDRRLTDQHTLPAPFRNKRRHLLLTLDMAPQDPLARLPRRPHVMVIGPDALEVVEQWVVDRFGVLMRQRGAC